MNQLYDLQTDWKTLRMHVAKMYSDVGRSQRETFMETQRYQRIHTSTRTTRRRYTSPTWLPEFRKEEELQKSKLLRLGLFPWQLSGVQKCGCLETLLQKRRQLHSTRGEL